ncbi:Quinate permease [Fusarium oxysporum f. sp. albedinis]|nr:Quinate permease [Fusarium oxysporum f. sp. albedinis]
MEEASVLLQSIVSNNRTSRDYTGRHSNTVSSRQGNKTVQDNHVICRWPVHECMYVNLVYTQVHEEAGSGSATSYAGPRYIDSLGDTTTHYRLKIEV